jgi:hypothetical protein
MPLRLWHACEERFSGASPEYEAGVMYEPGELEAMPSTGPSVTAAGTGLTGRSDQDFIPVRVGELESEETVVRLRIVIADPASLEADDRRPLKRTAETPVPARPRPLP